MSPRRRCGTRSSRSFFLRGLAGIALVPGAVDLGAVDASAQTVKLNGPLARPIGGDVSSVRIDASGKRVVYLADQETDDVFELFRVRPGAPPLRLNAPLPPHSSVQAFELSADGAWVVYRIDHSEPFELFSVPTRGGAAVPLNGPLVERGHVSSFRIDPAGRTAVFTASATQLGLADLLATPLDGSSPAVRLSRDGSVTRFEIAGDRVVFRRTLIGSGTALFSARLDGVGEPVPLTPNLARSSIDFGITPDGARVLWVDRDLFSVPIDGRGTPVRLSSGGGQGSVTAFRATADGRRAAYVKGGLFGVSTLGDESPVPLAPSATSLEVDPATGTVVFSTLEASVPRLYGVPILGGTAPVRLGGVGPVIQFRIAPEKRVVFVEDVPGPAGNPNELELRIAPVLGGTPSTLLASALVSGAVPLEFEVLTQDVIYRARTEAPEFQLFTVPLDGSRPARPLNGPLLAERDVQPSFAAGGDGRRVVFLADQDADDVFELYLAPSDGSRLAAKLNPPLPIGRIEGNVSQASFTPDGSRAVYLADENEDEVFELFSVNAEGGAQPVRLNAALVPGGDVLDFALTAQRAIYRADQDRNDAPGLYGVPLTGAAPTRLDEGIEPVQAFWLTVDGTKALYVTDEGPDDRYELHVAPVDGSTPAALLATGLLAPLRDIRTSAPSDRAVFVADPDGDGSPDLYGVPLAGGPPVRLSEPAPAGRVFREFQLTADGARVLWRVQSGSPARIALFSAPIDGSSSAISLSAALPSTTLVTGFALSPDGSRVAFVADGTTPTILELYSAPVDGSSGPLRLHTAAAELPRITPDGNRVVYFVPLATSAREIHVVPLDASTPPKRIGPAAFYDDGASPESRLRISPDGKHLVARGASLPGRPFRLYGIPLDGSAPPVELSRTEDSFGIARDDYRITPDGQELIYRIGDGPLFSGSELFQVPLDGLRAPLKISSQPTVHGFDLSADGKHVLHRTTQDDFGVIELYASRVRSSPRAALRRK